MKSFVGVSLPAYNRALLMLRVSPGQRVSPSYVSSRIPLLKRRQFLMCLFLLSVDLFLVLLAVLCLLVVRIELEIE